MPLESGQVGRALAASVSHEHGSGHVRRHWRGEYQAQSRNVLRRAEPTQRNRGGDCGQSIGPPVVRPRPVSVAISPPTRQLTLTLRRPFHRESCGQIGEARLCGTVCGRPG